MDYDKLIERFNTDAKDWNGDGYIKRDLQDAAAAIEALRADLEQERDHRLYAEQHADAFLQDCERLNAQLERVTAERDKAVEDLEEIMFKGGHNIDTCHFCTNEQCYGRGGTQVCVPKWRGQKED